MYSFRRCPYAIRARYSLDVLKVKVELREVILKDKPRALLDLGGRSTVPQLIENGIRYPESLDIMFWALMKSDRVELVEQLWPSNPKLRTKISTWLSFNDHCFKPWLDRYKYADRHPEHSEAYYRAQGERFLKRLNQRLSQCPYLMGDHMTLADIGIFPFIRQFAGVDAKWFEQSNYSHLKEWLNSFIRSDRFARVMQKYPAWDESQAITYFP